MVDILQSYSQHSCNMNLECWNGPMMRNLWWIVQSCLWSPPAFPIVLPPYDKRKSLLQTLIAEDHPSKTVHFFYLIYCNLLSNAHRATCSKCRTHLLFISRTEEPHTESNFLLNFAKTNDKQLWKQGNLTLLNMPQNGFTTWNSTVYLNICICCSKPLFWWDSLPKNGFSYI